MRYELLEYDIERYENIVDILEERIEQSSRGGLAPAVVKYEDMLIDNKRVLQYLKDLKTIHSK